MGIFRLLGIAMVIGSAASLVACGGETGGEANTSAAGGSTGEGGAGGAGGGSAVAGPIDTYTSPTDSEPDVGTSSYLIKGEKDAILVDGQLLTADAAKIVEMVKSSGKTLKTIFLTHAHPEHYASLETISKAFPEAQIVSTKAVVTNYNARAPGDFAAVKASKIGDEVDENYVTVTEVPGTVLDLEGKEIKIIEVPDAGESASAAALVYTDESAIFAGDILFNKVHALLGECGEKGWLANIEYIRGMGLTNFYPGHGAKAGTEILDEDKNYINEAIAILDAAEDVAAAKSQLKAKFPDYKGDYLLNLSTTQYFDNTCKILP